MYNTYPHKAVFVCTEHVCSLFACIVCICIDVFRCFAGTTNRCCVSMVWCVQALQPGIYSPVGDSVALHSFRSCSDRFGDLMFHDHFVKQMDAPLQSCMFVDLTLKPCKPHRRASEQPRIMSKRYAPLSPAKHSLPGLVFSRSPHLQNANAWGNSLPASGSSRAFSSRWQ